MWRMKEYRLTKLCKVIILLLGILISFCITFTVLTPTINKNAKAITNFNNKSAHKTNNYLAEPVLTINFTPDKAVIKQNYYAQLNMLIKVLKMFDNVTISINGYTAVIPNITDNKFSIALSLQRAKVAKDYLTQNGIAPERIIISGNGSKSPITNCTTKKDRHLNRRCEIYMKINK